MAWRLIARGRRSFIAGARSFFGHASSPPHHIAAIGCGHIVRETWPGPDVESDDDSVNAFGMLGTCGYHAVGTCRMGKDPHSIVDPVLRVKGVENLRVINLSIAPFVIAGNTYATVSALAHRAADLLGAPSYQARRAA